MENVLGISLMHMSFLHLEGKSFLSGFSGGLVCSLYPNLIGQLIMNPPAVLILVRLFLANLYARQYALWVKHYLATRNLISPP